jgi:hypothetical protein
MIEVEAKAKARRIVKLVSHLFIFTVVNLFLYFLDWRNDGKIDWAYWVTIGWGFGLLAQFFNTYFAPLLEEKITNNLINK